MGKTKKHQYPTPFFDRGRWYFKYVALDMSRHKKSTGHTNRNLAVGFIKEFIDKLEYGYNTELTLGQAVALYKDPTTNPRKNEADIVGRNYSDRHARHVVRFANDLEEALGRQMLDMDLCDISRIDCKRMRDLIIRRYGITNKGRSVFKMLKTILTQAADDGLIKVSPATQMADIKCEITPRVAIPLADIRCVIEALDPLPPYFRALFTFIAATGMRRGEVLAITPSQLSGDVLTIDRAFKDDSLKVIGKPKWDIVRQIPLCPLALSSLKELFALDPDNMMPLRCSSKRLYTVFNTIKLIGSRMPLSRPDLWQKLNPHVLRHSLNTGLILSGCEEILVAEYLAWQHQDTNVVQGMYTHLYSDDLRKVPMAITRLLGSPKEDVPGTEASGIRVVSS